MTLLLVVLIVILLVQLGSIKSRLNTLESRLGVASSPKPSPSPTLETVVQAQSSTTPFATPPRPQTPPSLLSSHPTEPSFVDRGIKWLRHDTLLKVGAFLLLLGFSWLVSYAFLNNWIGPVGRIALGIVAGIVIMSFGYWRIRISVAQGSVFLGLGASILLLTVYAARFLYDFFTPLTALLFMYLVSVFVSYASYAFKIRSLAFMGLVIGSVAPLLTHGDNDHIGLFAYLSVIVTGTVWLAALTRWRELTTASLMILFFYSLPFFLSKPFDVETLVLFAFFFAALFSLANILNILKAREQAGAAEMLTAFLNATFLLLWVLTGVPDEWQSLILIAWLLVFALIAFSLYRLSGVSKVFYVYGATSIAYLAAATAIELDGPTLTIAFLIEALIIVLTALMVTGRKEIALKLSLLFLLPLFLSTSSIFTFEWTKRIPWDHFSVLFLLALGLSGLGHYLFHRLPTTSNDIVARLWFYVGNAYFYLLVWLTLHAGILANDTATMLSLIFYTLIGLLTYIRGKLSNHAAARLYGLVLITFVIGHLLLVDVWNMDLFGRIITFAVIGILLMSTTFIKPRPPVPVSTV